eukprot:GILJ01000055.1.p2 GENE.GILJ01000055.1~~GILJ01000055.1.p2  ORF type:complete len:223 (+),score=36.19 GILJ01000055.1:68-670(+)
MFEKVVVIDCRGHLLGRVASIVAKELLNGQKIVAVRTEEMDISGSLFRNKLKFMAFLNKRMNTNPRRGPIHYRSPARMFWRTVRGMLPHKTPRGAAALERLKVFEGIPHPYDKVKRMVIPDALTVLRIKPGRHTTLLGDLAQNVGWRHQELVKKLEAKRKVKSAAFYQRKKALTKLKTKATQNAASSLTTVNQNLATLGF